MKKDIAIRLEIAKAAISAHLSTVEAERWLEWVINEPVVEKSYGDATDRELATIISTLNGSTHQAWLAYKKALSLVQGLKYESVLDIVQAGNVAKLYGIPRGESKVIGVLTKDTKSKTGIVGTYFGHGNSEIDKKTLLRWCCNHGALVTEHPYIRSMIHDTLVSCGLETTNHPTQK